MTTPVSMESREVPAPGQPHPTTWHGVQAGLWVGQRDGEYTGMIEHHGGEGYVATSRFGRALGTFGTMEAALVALQ